MNNAHIPSRKRRPLVAVAIWSLAAVAAGWLVVSILPRRIYSDGISIDRPARNAVVRLVAWEDPKPVDAPFNEGADTYEPCIAADGSRMIFTRGRARNNAELYASTWTGKTWGDPVPLKDVNTGSDELGPALSDDGKLLFFYSDRDGGMGGYDIWVARWDGFTWVAPTNAGPAVNSAFNEYGPALSPGGGRLFFSSNRPRRALTEAEASAWKATLRELMFVSDYDIYMASVLPDADTNTTALPRLPELADATRVDALCSPAHEGQIVITPRGDFLYFSSDRAGGEGGFDLYRSRLLHDTIQPPENLGAPINTAVHEMDPALRAEGFGLVFSSNRDPADPLAYRLYTSVSRDVFVRYDSARWQHLWWSLLRVKWWILIVLATLALLAYLIRNFTNPELRRQRSLLHTCMLVSALVHALLLFLFAFWLISAEVIKTLSEPAMEVAVDLDALAQEKIALDIRDTVTELPASADTLVVEQITHRMPIPELTPPAPANEPMLANSFVEPLAFDERPEPPPPQEERRLELTAQPAAVALPTMEMRPTLPTLEMPSAPSAVPAATPDTALQAPAALAQQQATPVPAAAATANAAEPVAPATSESAMVSAVATSTVAEADISAAPEPPTQMPAAAAPVVLASAPTLETRQAPAPAAGTAAEAALPAPAPTLAQSAAAPKVDQAGPQSAVSPPTPSPTAIEPSTATAAVAQESALRSQGPAQPAEDVRELPRLAVLTTPILTVTRPGPAAAAPTGPALADDRRRSPQPATAPRNATQPSATVVATVSPTARDTRPLDTVVLALAEHGRPLPSLTGVGDTAAAQLPALGSASQLRMETAALASVPQYLLRQPEKRGKVLARLGGDEKSEGAVQQSLNWLIKTQEADGHWNIAKYGGEGGHDGAATGLSLLCFFGWGAKHTEAGPYQDATRRAIDWLLDQMKPDGDLRTKDMYDHGIACMALCEAYGLTQDPRLKEPAERAIAFIIKAQHAQTGGWRYGPGDPGDTSVFGWQLMAVKSAEMAGLAVPPEAFKRADNWLNSVGGGSARGLCGYQGPNPAPGMVAEGMFCRQLLGHAPAEPMMQEAADYMKTRLPTAIDFYYIYYGTLALFQHQGPVWDEWNNSMRLTVMQKQLSDGPDAGSWNPEGNHGPRMGRIVATAMATLSLEVYYRYLPLYGLRPVSGPAQP